MKKSDLAYWADQAFNVERIRVAAQVRIAHLAKRKQQSPETEKFLEYVQNVENFVDGYMAEVIISHPAWSWASRIKGIGKENFPKVIGLVEAFGKYYEPGDSMIPKYVKREPETYYIYDAEKDKTLEKTGVWVAGIERLATISKLWKYSGFSVEDGHAPKRESGQKIGFNGELRMALYRVGLSLIKQVRGEPGVWRIRYESILKELEKKYGKQKIAIISAPKIRVCPNGHEVEKKKTFYCPECGLKLSLKKEGEGAIFKGHVFAQAMREMLKDFQACIWLVWREAAGLPVSQPYKVEKLGHEPLQPWKMVDREANYKN